MDDLCWYLDVCQKLEILHLACLPQLERHIVFRIVCNHCNLRSLNLVGMIRLEVDEAKEILENIPMLDEFALTPKFVVGEKRQWQVLFHCSSLAGTCITCITGHWLGSCLNTAVYSLNSTGLRDWLIIHQLPFVLKLTLQFQKQRPAKNISNISQIFLQTALYQIH